MVNRRVQHRFGEKLRAVRERKGITLKKTAECANVSESLISQIERNKVSPSIDTLLSIADVLEIDLEYLFQDQKRNKKVTLLHTAERKKIVQDNVILQQLSILPDPLEDYAIEAFMIEIVEGGEKGHVEYGHAGNELGFILQGKGELIYGTETYSLNDGDSVSFSSNIPHILKNTGNKTLKAIWVITPPRMVF